LVVKLPSEFRISKLLVIAVVCGAFVSLGTGLVENPPRASIIGYRYYGHPVVWRVTRTFELPAEYILTNLAIDAAFWIIISSITSVALEKIALPRLKVDAKGRTLLLCLILFLPLGLVMDLVHESGHALWGVAVGGRLTYMQIGYFEIYPNLAITQQFSLGRTQVAGLPSKSAQGFFLLGGSMTTNVIAWLLGLILLRTRLGDRTRLALKVLGLFGLLDLPFYVVFPQIGLLHWIFLGGDRPEPLLGARNIGVPDSVFYAVTFLLTIGLIFLYSDFFRKKASKCVISFLGQGFSSIRLGALNQIREAKRGETSFNPDIGYMMGGPVV